MSRPGSPPARRWLHCAVVGALLALVAACGPSDRVRDEVATRNAQSVSGLQPGPVSDMPTTPNAGSADAGVDEAAASSTPVSAGDSGGGADQAADDSTGSAESGTTDSGDGGTSAPADTAAAPEGNGGATDVGVTADTIKIGGVYFNGGYVDKYSQVAEQAAQAYFNYINDQGGVHGRRIEYVPCDTAGQAQGTASCLNQLLNEEQVFAMGPSVDFNLDTVGPTIEDAGVPWVGSSGLYAEEFQSPMMFPSQLNGADVGALILTFAAQRLDATTVGVSWVTVGPGPACLERIKALAPDLGAEVIVDAGNEDVNNGLSSQAEKISNADPDVVLFCNDPVNTIKFVHAAGSKGYEPPNGWVGGFVAADDVPAAMGRPGIGLYGFSSYDFYDSNSEDVQRYREITEFYYPRIFHHQYTQSAYVGAVSIVEALMAAGPQLTRDRLLQVIRDVNVTSMGLTFDFSNVADQTPSGIMLRANSDLEWEQVADRFQVAG